ncbi:MAG: hypothetical protein ACF8XB_08445 [Planctomycetota bacterium JB042]
MKLTLDGSPLAVARVVAVVLSVGVAAWIVQRAHERANPERPPLDAPAHGPDAPDAPDAPPAAADGTAAAPVPGSPVYLSSSKMISDLGFTEAFPAPVATPTFLFGSKSGDLSEVLPPAGPPVRPFLPSSKSMVIDPTPVERP